MKQILQRIAEIKNNMLNLAPRSQVSHSNRKSFEAIKNRQRGNILASLEKLSHLKILQNRNERTCTATKVKLSMYYSENTTRVNVHVEKNDQNNKLNEVRNLIESYRGKEIMLSEEIEDLHNLKIVDQSLDKKINRYNKLLMKVPRNDLGNMKLQRPVTPNLENLPTTFKIRVLSGIKSMTSAFSNTEKNFFSISSTLERELHISQKNHKFLEKNVLQKSEEIFLIQSNIQFKEQESETERLRVEQIAHNLSNSVKLSENEVMSLRKLLSRDTNSKEKQIKILQVKHTVTNISKILSMLHPKVLHGDLKFSCTAEKSKMQHQILTALGKIMSHKQLIQDQLVR